MSPKVSVIVPVKEINDYIRQAAVRHLALDYPDFEVLVLPDHAKGGYFGPKVRIISTYPQTGPADKRDRGAKEAEGEILAFIDDDAYPHKAWLENAVGYFADDRVAAVCGPGVTPEEDTVWQKASGWVQASKLGGGNYTYRFMPHEKREVDDYPSMNFIVRKLDFEAVGGFDSHFWPGEDTKLCLDLTQKLGKKIIYDPDILVYHHRRPLFRPHLNQIGRYGLHRGHFARILPQTSRRFSYFIPSFFTLFIFLFAPLLFILNRFESVGSQGQVAGAFAGFPWYQIGLLQLMQPYTSFLNLTVLLLGLYIGFLLLTAFWVCAKERDWRVAALVIPGIFLTHVWYGLRFIQGFFSKGLKR